jgi:hypothetical protein
MLIALQTVIIIFISFDDDEIPDRFFATYSFMSLLVWLKVASTLRFSDRFNFFIRQIIVAIKSAITFLVIYVIFIQAFTDAF